MQPALKGAAAMFFQYPRPVSAGFFCNWRVNISELNGWRPERSMRAKNALRTLFLFGGLVLLFLAIVPICQGKSHWPESISGENGFYDLGQAITKDPGFPSRGSDVEKARFAMSRLPEIAKKYGLDAGSGGKVSDSYVGLYRKFGSDPEGADGLKGALGWGNCGEWTYAFQQVLAGVGVQSKPVFADKEGGAGHSGGFTGTDTTLYVEERTPGGAISRRVFDAFRAAYHGTDYQPARQSVDNWKDVPLTDNDRLPRDRGGSSWQNQIGGKPFIKDAGNQTELSPQQPVDVQEKNLEERRRKGQEERRKGEEEKKQKEAEEARKKAEEDRKRKEAEEAKRKEVLQGALKQAGELIAAARASVGRAQAAIGAVRTAAAGAKSAGGAANAAQSAVQQARGAVTAAQSACAKVVSEGVINAAKERADAASGEVGFLYQEALRLAGESCGAATQAQQTSNSDAQRVFEKKAKGLAEMAKSKAASAEGAVKRAKAEAAQAVQQSVDRNTAIGRCETAKSAISSAQGQVSAEEGKINEAEATLNTGAGQVETAKSEAQQAATSKAGALGVLAPYGSEPEAQNLIAAVKGIAAPNVEGIDKEVESDRTAIQNARTLLSKARDQLGTWEGVLTCCDGLTSTDRIAQEATGAASAAELFLPRISAAVSRAGDCAAGMTASATGDKGYDPSKDPNLKGGKKPVDTGLVDQLGDKFQKEQPTTKGPKEQTPATEQPQSYTGIEKPGEEPGTQPPGGQPPSYPPGEGPGPGTVPSDGVRELPPSQEPGTDSWSGPWKSPGEKPGKKPKDKPPKSKPPKDKPPKTKPGKPDPSGDCPPGCHKKPGTNKCHCGEE